MNLNNSDLSIVELFSGPGGLGLGFHFEGFSTIVAYEYEDDCINTYKANFPETRVLKKDLSDFTDNDIQELKAYLVEKTGKDTVDIVMGGPPCRSFSTANPKKLEKDERDFLYRTLIKVANALNAKYFLMENVADLNSKTSHEAHDKKVLHVLFEDLINTGYHYINFDVLNAADFGVAQTRERLIIIATKDERLPLTLPSAVFCKDKEPRWVTVEAAFKDLPEVTSPKDTESGLHQHLLKNDGRNSYCDQYGLQPESEYTKYCRGLENNYGYIAFPWIKKEEKDRLSLFLIPGHTDRIIERYSLLKEDENQGDLVKRLKNTLSDEELQDLYSRKVLPEKVFIQKNRRLPLQKPSRTVTSHAREELVHPKLNRNITAREAARLQSFPDWYTFKGINQKPYKGTELDIGNGRDYYQQIGDAVPPLLSAAIAKQIKINLTSSEPSLNGVIRKQLIQDIIKRKLTIQEMKKEKYNKVSFSSILNGLDI